jgi:putative transcriptional regulator
MKNRVHELREKAGLSQGQLADLVDVSRQKERYTPSLPLALALARYFGTSIEKLFTEES